MGEVVPACTLRTLHPPSPLTVHQLSRLALKRVNCQVMHVLMNWLLVQNSSDIKYNFKDLTLLNPRKHTYMDKPSFLLFFRMRTTFLWSDPSKKAHQTHWHFSRSLNDNMKGNRAVLHLLFNLTPEESVVLKIHQSYSWYRCKVDRTNSYSANHDNWCTVGGDGGCRVGEVRASTISPMPDHKGFKLQ